jgi:hypothetical protein
MMVFILILAVISLVVGAIFVYMGFSKQAQVKAGLADEKIAYNFSDDKTAAPKPLETMDDLQKMADTLKQHRNFIAPSYSELTAKNKDHKFDPTNPSNLSYAQGMNLGNSVMIALLGMGMTWMMIGVGAFMWLVGFALFFINVALMKTPQ